METRQTSKLENKLAVCLLALRLTIALVFMMWALDKIFVPEHASKVFAAFYSMNISSHLAVALGIIQVVFVTIFALGLCKNVTYLLILIFHAGSTLSALTKYFDPFNNLLFFAAWPMLAACFVLYLLREFDVLTLSNRAREIKTVRS
ncbi:hypothetical protein [Vibrio aphrogenes]|uniref:hypothetical protein n=1 Tax=Vibrio aphrogenes TaxID=1891186 RepID=UPI000B34E999|nr:hypothetical protein [Vibrio aphrogenes]